MKYYKFTATRYVRGIPYSEDFSTPSAERALEWVLDNLDKEITVPSSNGKACP